MNRSLRVLISVVPQVGLNKSWNFARHSKYFSGPTLASLKPFVVLAEEHKKEKKERAAEGVELFRPQVIYFLTLKWKVVEMERTGNPLYCKFVYGWNWRSVDIPLF